MRLPIASAGAMLWCAIAFPPAGATAATAPAPMTAPTVATSPAASGPAAATAGAAPAPAAVDTSVAPGVVPAVASADPLPPMNFYASIAANEIYDKLRADSKFGALDRELPGSPIMVRVTHSLQPTAGGMATGLLSAIWAGSTLGLLPVVTSNTFVLTYEVRVNGNEVLRYDFQRTLTRASNIWSNRNDPTYGLGKDGLDWALGTVAEFTARAAQDPALLSLAREYAFFFGAGKP